METGYSILQSSNFFVECFRELMPLVVAATLLYLYYKKKITIVDALLYAFATEAYTMLYIGPTFTATLFVSVFILVEQAHLLVTGRQQIKREYLFILMLPFLSQVAVMLMTQLYKDPFYYPNGSNAAFYTRPLYFYLKTYLPLFAIGAKIVQDKDTLSFESFLSTMKRIARISCIIAAVQIAVQVIFRNAELSELLGLQHRYLIAGINGPLDVRVQALFSEPKTFSAFLSLAIPIFMRERNYRMTFFAFVMAVLTSSQTFWVNILAATLLFTAFGKISAVRIKIVGTLGVIIGLFMAIASSKELLLKHYMSNRNDPVYRAIFERSAYRYDNEIWQKNNIIMGIPLQRDMELPVVDFLKDEPYLLWTGYGAGNSTFIPTKYFFGQMTYQNRVAGVGGHNLNMRWFFILAEFGAISLLFFFFILTKTNEHITLFNKNYLAYVAICFFFSQIDLFFLIVALISAYGDNEE